MTEPDTNQYQPDTVSPPGDTLQEILLHLGMSQAELAERTGRPRKTINEIMKGKASITPETALQLERVLGTPAGFWIRREADFQEWSARQAEATELAQADAWARRFPVSEMIKRGWIQPSDSGLERVRRLLRFFGIARPALLQKRVASFRRFEAFEIDESATEAWLQQAMNQAAKLELAAYDRDAFLRVLERVRKLSRRHIFPVVDEVVRACVAVGVAVVFVDELPGTRVAGASLWASPTRAIIALSHRNRRDDHFWFAFFHEAGHILHHPRASPFVEMVNKAGGKSMGSGTDHQEDEANAFAKNHLIPTSDYEAFLARGEFSQGAIERFAQKLEIAAGIVVGRLQKEGVLDWATRLNKLKRSIDEI